MPLEEQLSSVVMNKVAHTSAIKVMALPHTLVLGFNFIWVDLLK